MLVNYLNVKRQDGKTLNSPARMNPLIGMAGLVRKFARKLRIVLNISRFGLINETFAVLGRCAG